MICKICGKELARLGNHLLKSHSMSSKEYYDIYLKRPKEGICPVDKKETEFRGITKGGYAKFCCRECANQFNASTISEKALNRTAEENKAIANKARQTRFEHFGDENYGLFGSKRHQEAIKDKYSVEYVMQSTIVQEKSKQTCLEKYGHEYSFQSDNNKEKSKQTMLENYGVENAFQLKKSIEHAHTPEAEAKRQTTMHLKIDEIVAKRVASCKITWANKSEDEKQEFYSRIRNTITQKIAQFEIDYNCTHRVRLVEKYGSGWLSLKLPQISDGDKAYISNEYLQQIIEYSSINHNAIGESKPEKELLEYIRTIYHGSILENTKRVISPLELDVYLPDIGIAFEFNGIYWHSEKCKEPSYHFDKSMMCKEKGIRLIHIYEWEWSDSQDEVKELVNNIINSKFAVDESTLIYCDFNKSNGSEYEELGYTLVGYTEPNIWYYKDYTISEEPVDTYDYRIFGSGYLIYQKEDNND